MVRCALFVMQKGRKEPEVIVFEEPQQYLKKTSGKDESKARKIFLDGSVADIFALGNSKDGDSAGSDDEVATGRRGKKRKVTESEETQDFRSILRDVQKFAASALTGREKQRHVVERIKALGGEERKKCVPYPIYQEMMKQKRQEGRDSIGGGMSVTSSKRKKDTSKPQGKGRWKDRLSSLDPPVGRFKKGVLKVTEPDVKKFR